MSTTKTRKKATPKKLDLACGQHPREGFVGVDLWAPDAEIKADLTRFPWPFPDSSVDELHSSHYVEHTPMGDPDGLVQFMDECYRILKPEGTITIIHPVATSTRAFQDPYHRRFIPQQTWYYFNAEWRKSQGLDHYPITSDFDVVSIVGLGVPEDLQTKSDEAQRYAHTHYWHTIADLQVILAARK